MLSIWNFLWKDVRRASNIRLLWILEIALNNPRIRRFQHGVSPWQFKCLRLNGEFHSCMKMRQIHLGNFLWQLQPLPRSPHFSASEIGVVIRHWRESGWGISDGAGVRDSTLLQRWLLFVFIWMKSHFAYDELYQQQPFKNRKSKAYKHGHHPFPS